MIRKKSTKKLVQPEPLPISEPQSKITTSSPASGNTFVVRSPNVAPYKIVTVEEAKATLLNMELGLVGLENEFNYYSILNQVNSLMSSIIDYGFSKKILSCEKIELSN